MTVQHQFRCPVCNMTTPVVDHISAGCNCNNRTNPCILISEGEGAKRQRIHLGRGEISWNSVERREDRYGTVRLFECGEGEESLPLHNQQLHGQYGRLVAVVVDGRKSEHIGDMFRGISPPDEAPANGTEFILGADGEIFFEHIGGIHEQSELERHDDEMMNHIFSEIFGAFQAIGEEIGAEVEIKQGHPAQGPPPEEYDQVGIRPVINERPYDWLSPNILYQIHSSVVDLYFEPASAQIQEEFTNNLPTE